MMPDEAGKSGIWTVSNVITVFRIMLVPVFVAALLAPWPEWFGMDAAFSNDWKGIVAAGIFVLISCTDWLDGYLARSRNEVTDFGKFMDPLADKILVAAALIALVELGDLPTWVVLVILAREFIVSGVRMMAAAEGVVIAASMLGKFKTVFQMIAIVLFTVKDSHMIGGFSEALSDTLWLVSWAVMLVAVGLTIASMLDYLVKARELIGLAPANASRTIDEAALGRAAEKLVGEASAVGKTIASAESLTGGMIGQAITSVAGSSAVYPGSIVSYSAEVKQELLDVPADVVEKHGVVSEKCACAMAEGARLKLGVDAAVAVTGIAGPGGAEEGKPVGTVWIGVSTGSGTSASLHHFEGEREQVRLQTSICALEALADAVSLS